MVFARSADSRSLRPLVQPRRDLLKLGGLAALTGGLPSLMPTLARAATSQNLSGAGGCFGRAKQVILLFLAGGPPQHETFDPKPLAPAEIRGPFRPIQTNVPGIDLCELLPRTAVRADKLAIIRSMFTNNQIHGGSGYWVLTGQPMLTSDGENAAPTDWPNLASIVKRFRPSDKLPSLSAVSLPELFIGNGGNIESGQFGGILGPQWSPEIIECHPAEPHSPLGGLYASKVPADQMRRRVTLLDALGHAFDATPRSATVQLHEGLQRQAFELLTTGGAREAFRLEDEPDRVRDRYGRHPWGQSVLLARRLVEAGVRFVTVNWPRVPGDRGVDNPIWDTHARNFDRMEDCLAPQFDVGFTALLDDLEERGLLDETLVIAVGEFGRTPKVNANAGRDHWGNVFSCVLAGAGISGGQVYGSSDREGGYPATDPVNAGHLAATVFHLTGIDAHATFQDRQGRILPVTGAEPLYKLFGEEPATVTRQASSGDIAFVPPYHAGLLAHPDFQQTTALRPLDALASPKGWRAEATGLLNVRLLDNAPLRSAATERRPAPLVRPDQGGRPTTDTRASDQTHAAIGLWSTPIEPRGAHPADLKTSAVLAQQIRDPQAGRFTAKAFISGGGSSREEFERLVVNQFRCRLIFFRFAQPTKSARDRTELASMEFVPTFGDGLTEAHPDSGQPIQLEAQLAPTPGVNFTFGLGIGIAVIVEQKTTAPLVLPSNSQSAFIRLQRIDLNFEGWRIG